MNRRKSQRNLRLCAALLAAVLLFGLTGCGSASVEPMEPPEHSNPVVVITPKPVPTEPEPEAPEPAETPEPEIPEPAVSPEPEVSEPVESPEPEVTEPVVTPEPEVSQPVESPEPEVSQPVESPQPEVGEPTEPQPDEYGIYAPRVGLYELGTLAPVHEKAADVQMATASMSKIVTAITALRYASPDTVYTVGTELQLVQPGASICFIAQGHRLTLYHLLMGMLLPSGCDASYTIAVNVAREVAEDPTMSDQAAVEYFCGLMNQVAAELGAVNSHFTNPDGWDHAEHYTTVRDMAIFAAHAMEYETIREIVSTPEKWVMFASGENITWRNSNALLHGESGYYYPGAVGMKTGTTTAAGNCLLSVVEVEGVQYIAVVSGSPTRNGRYEDTLKLLELVPNE